MTEQINIELHQSVKGHRKYNKCKKINDAISNECKKNRKIPQSISFAVLRVFFIFSLICDLHHKNL